MLMEKIKPFIEALPENKTPATNLRMSDAGSCVRLLTYEGIYGKKPLSFEDVMRFEVGHGFHYLIQDLFLRALGEDIFDFEKEISSITPDGQVIVGHPDGRVKSMSATLEIKSVSENTYEMVSNNNKPLDQHIEQANLYAFTMKDQWIIIIYVNRNTGAFLEFMFETSDEMARSTLSKMDRVAMSRKLKTLPARPYADKTQAPCWYCPFNEECYESFVSEVKSFGSAKLTDPVIVSGAREATIHRQRRLDADKAESKLKAILGQKMSVDLKLKNAQVEDNLGKIFLSIEVGKNGNLLTTIKEAKSK